MQPAAKGIIEINPIALNCRMRSFKTSKNVVRHPNVDNVRSEVSLVRWT